jgi:predicted amidohydrolase
MVWEDKKANQDKITGLLEAGPAKNYDWVIFPEMTLSGFSMAPDKATLDASDLGFFSALARKHHTHISFGGVQSGLNKLITMDPAGAIISNYAKIHLYSFGGEDKTYKPGSQQDCFRLQELNVVPAVCFDLRFPYLFWNQARRADLFVVIASWPARRAQHWMRLLQARAIENQSYVVGVNRTGNDPLLEYNGNSMIFDPLGKVVLDCEDQEGLFVSDVAVDKATVLKIRDRFPFINDRRSDMTFA